MVDVAEDVQAIADQMGLGRVGVAGASVGGPAAIAVAAGLPERVSRVGLVVAPAPIFDRNLDFFAGMDADSRKGYEFVGLDGPELESWLTRDWEETLSFVRDVLPTLGSTAGFEMLQAAFEEGVRPGPGGLWDDMMALVAEWGFDLTRVRMPVRLIQAEDDTTVPQGHTDWWLRHLPQAEVTYIPGGHIGAPSDEADRLERELALLTWVAPDNT